MYKKFFFFNKACPDITPGSKCDALSDCTGVQCCFDTNFELGLRNVYVKIRINCAANDVEYEIETEKYNKGLATLTDGTVFTPSITHWYKLCLLDLKLWWLCTSVTSETANNNCLAGYGVRIVSCFLAGSTETKTIGTAPTFSLSYSKTADNGTHQMTASFTIKTGTSPVTSVMHDLIDGTSTIATPTCTARKRRRRSLSVTQ